MNLEEIMKPYYNKKDNIEKQYIERKNFLTLRLDNLRNNKAREIEEYVQNAVAERPDFYAGYGAMIRKDLEQAYAKKEQELEQEIKDNDKYYRLDVRELVSIKEDLRKELISARKEIELQIAEVGVQLDSLKLKYARFEPVYDENYNMLNGDERANIFNENHRLIEVKYNLEKQLEEINKNLSITEITKEEASILMMSLTSWEQEELNRRRAFSVVEEVKAPEIEELEDVKNNIPVVAEEELKLNEKAIKTKIREFLTQVFDWKENPKLEKEIQELIKQNPELEEKINKLIEGNSTTEEISDLINEYPKLGELLGDYFSKLEVKPEYKKTEEIITDNAPVVTEEPVAELPVEPEIVPEEEKIEEDVVLVDSFKELLDTVFEDVLNSTKKLRTIKLEGTNPVQLSTRTNEEPDYSHAGDLENDAVSLPNGAYLNKRDIFKALDNYRKENKGRTFKVKGYNDTFEINRKTIRLVKKHLRECSAIKLVSEKKLGHFDIKRVYGKEQADKFVELGKVETKMASGEYINLNEFAYNLKDVFAEKGITWFEKFKNKLSRKQKKQPVELSYEESNALELDDQYVIKK